MRDFDEAWVFKTNEFLEHAFGPAARGETLVRCPCSYCDNRKRITKDKMGRHLVKHGFTLGYTRWIYHGEGHIMREEVVRAQVEAFDGDGRVPDMIDDYHQAEFAEDYNFNPNTYAREFFQEDGLQGTLVVDITQPMGMEDEMQVVVVDEDAGDEVQDQRDLQMLN
jgi:hypothetical protein